MSNLTVVDGSNVLNEIGRFFAGCNDLSNLTPMHGSYLRDWLDVDRLIEATLRPARFRGVISTRGTGLGTVIFRSRKKIGPDPGKSSPWSISGEQDLTPFWARQGGAADTSVMLVEIPGAGTQGEKGVDASIIVYLFETVENWSSCVLFTNDTDFVPAVWSLRRKGKRVLCAARAVEQSSPLVQSCQDFVEWDEDFLREDFAFYEFLQPGGVLDRFLADGQSSGLQPTVRLTATGLDVFYPTLPQVGIDYETSRLNNMLANTPLTSGRRDSLIFEVRPAKARDGGGALLIDGCRRHVNLFSAAAWVRLLRPA